MIWWGHKKTLFYFAFHLLFCIFVSKMKKKDFIIDVLLAVVAAALLLLCVNSVDREVESETLKKEVVNHVSNH